MGVSAQTNTADTLENVTLPRFGNTTSDVVRRLADLETLNNHGHGHDDGDVEGGTILSYDSGTGIAVVALDNGDTVSVTIVPTAIAGGGGSTGPLTTKGDVWGYSTVDDRIPVGNDGDVLMADSSTSLGVAWGAGELYAAQSQASAATIDFVAARVHALTLTGTPVAITISGATSGIACGLTIYLVQDGTGNRVVTWPGSVKWPNGVAPVLSTPAGTTDLVVMESFDGGTVWYANLAGKAFA